MLEIYKNNTAYLHIPKTAGKSIRNMLTDKYGVVNVIDFTDTNLGSRHRTFSELKVAVDIKKFSTIFTTIRNPYDRVVSLYFWIMRAKINSDARKSFEAVYPEYMGILNYNFEEFIDWFIENELLYKDYLFLDGKLPTNLKFIHFENIQTDLISIFDSNIIIPHYNKTTHKPFMDYYSINTLSKLYEAEKWAFTFFNYKG